MTARPNIIIIMTDQQRADVCSREGFTLDTTPFLDSLARRGAWLNRAYTSAPVCAPARVSMLTGRYPSATRVRTNHNIEDVIYESDLIDVLRAQGYATALCGKNHSHLTPERLDHWFVLRHSGGYGQPGRTAAEEAFDQYLVDLNHRVAMEPTPHPLECQGPYRAVSDAQKWISGLGGQPFFLWLSFAEPHNPYQVPEPYFSLFPPETLPPPHAGADSLKAKGFKFELIKQMGQAAFPDYDEQVARLGANYTGMLRLIDDQVKRFVEFLWARGLAENTILVFLSDHGDFMGEYGLARKGPEVPEYLMRIPMFWIGPGIVADAQAHPAHVSIVDVMPTLCEAIGVPLPAGVQGRSLWPLLTGDPYPEDEFNSAYAEQGFGGLHYGSEDPIDFTEDGLDPAIGFDSLNRWSQSGTMRMLRLGPWKLVYDMQGQGQLYNLPRDPAELDNLFERAEYSELRGELLGELLAWVLRAQDPLPLPRHRYVMKTDPRNYWSPYR